MLSIVPWLVGSAKPPPFALPFSLHVRTEPLIRLAVETPPKLAPATAEGVEARGHGEFVVGAYVLARAMVVAHAVIFEASPSG
ncbi:hypothetical protein N7497_005410 [Penicillium chrysogenum]|nr:hypothetical protein N7497_005410 [Penicillium chrysogenum]